MENKGLLFIPDISGFTKFVHESEIEHSRFIIQDLLEILINSNQVGLEISDKSKATPYCFIDMGIPRLCRKCTGKLKKCSAHFTSTFYLMNIVAFASAKPVFLPLILH